MTLPSIKTLERLTAQGCRIEARDGARLFRRVLESRNREELQTVIDSRPDAFGPAFTVLCSDLRYHELQYLKLEAASQLLENHGVECIPKGHNAKSPMVEYVNTGDSYALTLMWTRGRYVLGSWGDIVERGNYV